MGHRALVKESSYHERRACTQLKSRRNLFSRVDLGYPKVASTVLVAEALGELEPHWSVPMRRLRRLLAKLRLPALVLA